MSVFIESERLYIRELQPGDAAGMYEMDADPEVHKYVGKTPVQSLKQSEDVVAFIRQQYTDFGIARWAVVEKGTDEFAGWTGFKFMKGPINGLSDYYDFGYRLKRKFWGRGYATESGHAALHYGIKEHGFKDIYAMTDVDNAASRRVLEKLGFELSGIFNYDAEPTWREAGEPTTMYKWLQNQ
ncbi:MAG: GNAT family N-acetyltransferase [Bacteroidota bacterium]